jgi:hypothetical protein
MKRIITSIVLAVIFSGSYFLITFSVRRSFLFGPGPFTVGRLAADVVRDSEDENESKVLLVFLSVSLVSVAVPFYLLLSLVDARRRTMLP